MSATDVLKITDGSWSPTQHFERRPRRRAGKRLAALIAGALAIAGCSSGSVTGTTSMSNSGGPPRAIPVGVTAAQLHSIADSAGHPIFWAGSARGTYELTTIADGRTYIRYLPPGVPVGSGQTFLTVGTYQRPSPPFNGVRRAALAKHATIRALGKTGELAVQYPSRPTSVYLIFPGANYEVEVYDPSAATAFRLATSGKVVPIP